MAFQMKMPGSPGDDLKKAVRQLHSWLYQLNETLHYTLSNLDEENFTDDFLLSIHQNGGALTEAVEAMGQRVDALFSETWTEVPLTSSVTGGTHAPTCCRRGQVAYVRGDVLLASFCAQGSYVNLAQLPEAVRPSVPAVIPVCCNNGFARLTVQENGYLVMQNLTGSTLPASAAVCLTLSYAL